MVLSLFIKHLQMVCLLFNKVECQRDLNNDLSTVSEWVFEWRMQFNPDPSKLTNEIQFCRWLSSY